ncbi:MAG TPA: hypothetical protein VIU43_05490 [Nitrosospira sp.]
MIDVDEIKKEVAVRNNVLLGNDDPIIITATMVDVLLEKSIGVLNAQHEANMKAMMKAMQQGLAEGKATSANILSQGASYASEQVHTAVTAAMDESREELRKDLIYAWKKIDSARKTVLAAATVSGVCAVVSLTLALLF